FRSAATDELHIRRVDFESMPRLSVAISPLFDTQPTFDVDRFAFGQILGRSLCLPAPKGHAKPSRLILHLSAFIFAALVCGHTKTAHWSALWRVTQLGI